MTAPPNAAPQRIFVTGATGVVGAHALPLLIAQGHEVIAVGRSPEKRARLQAIGARAIELDTFDVGATRHALEGVDTVINLATHMPASSFQMLLRWKWRENDLLRREGSAALVQAALVAGVQRFIQESFAPVYEDGGDKWIAEGWPLRPAPYNRTTLDAERSASLFTAQGSIGIIARFAGFYGPDSSLSEMIGVVKKGYSPLPGKFTAYWSSIAHEDAATAIVALVGAPAGAYNVSDDEPIARRDFAGTIAKAVGAKPPRPMPGFLAALGGTQLELLSRSQRMSNAKLKAATGWSPRWRSAREGIPAAIERLSGL